ncbi:acyltransferase family protein [Pseudomonas paralactis]|uniref:Acyltransferase family protein n=1 Tax=Pseudomonas paralactis TaxID=1615673 RepID=A0ABS0V230_9PSED|nr:acyltransferase family protein [Pseudomonas paralactis]
MLKDFSVGLDFARVIACLMVVFLHVSAAGIGVFDENWMYSNIYDSFVRSCVPIFLMISGALLLCRKQSALDFYKKRFLRIFPPLLFWSIFYVSWKASMGVGYGGVLASVGAIFKGPVYYHLWYLYALVGIYLFVPFMSKIYMGSSGVDKKLYISIWFVVACIMPTVLYFYPEFGDLFSVYGLSSFVGLAGYVFLGAYVFDSFTVQQAPVSIKVESMIFVACGILTAAFTHGLSISDGSPNQFFYSYLSPVVVFGSVSAFKLLVVFGSRMSACSKILNTLSGCTLGIYCIHVFVMNRFSLVYGPVIEGQSLIWVIPALSVSIFLLSLIPIYVLRMFRPLRPII